MKATVIVDNIGNIYPGEWGLCIYIENNGKNILLDAGSSNLFIDNAKKLIRKQNLIVKAQDQPAKAVPTDLYFLFVSYRRSLVIWQ